MFAAISGVVTHFTVSGSESCVAVAPLVNSNIYSFTTPGVSTPSVSVSDATSPHLCSTLGVRVNVVSAVPWSVTVGTASILLPASSPDMFKS